MAQVRGADPPGSRLASSACLSRRWACSAFVATDLVGLLPLAFAALPLGLLLVLVPLRGGVPDVGSSISGCPDD